MVTVIRTYYHMGYGLISNFGNVVNHHLSFVNTTLTVSNEDAFIGNNKHADRGKSLITRRPELFV